MPPKKPPAKGGKGAKKKEGDGPDVSVQMRRVKVEVNKVVQELQIPPELELDKLFITKFNDALVGSTGKLLFQGDKPGVLGTQALSLVLRELCPVFVPIKTMCFWRCMVGDEGLKALCENCLYKKKMDQHNWAGYQHLELMDVRLSPRGCEYLSQQLAANIPLVSLVLDFNAIGDEGVMLLAEGLRTNSELHTLSLSYCQVGPAGGATIGNEIIRCTNVKRLLLKGNRIMAQGLVAISRNLGKSTTLVELDLSDNSILADVLALNAFCEALRTNISLASVNMEHNIIEDEGAAMFADTLQMCPGIKVFKISGQGVSKDVFKEVLKDGKDGKKKKGGKKGGKKKKK